MRALTLVVCGSAFLVGCCTADLGGLPDLPPGKSLAIDGHVIFVRQVGEGPDVVLLHGLGDSSIGWQYLEDPLVEAGYRVTIWDALGAGRSHKPAGGDYGIEAHLRRLTQVLDRLNVERAVVVGHSLGGSVALMLAQKHPERTKALFLIDPGAYREGAVDDSLFWDVPLLAEALLGLLCAETLVDYGLEQNFRDRSKIPEELRRLYIREAKRDGVVGALIEQERQLIPEDPEAWEAGHRQIAVPMLILWGEHDALVPVEQGRRLAREVPGAELIVLPGLAHSPQLEAPEKVLEHLLPFLDRHAR